MIETEFQFICFNKFAPDPKKKTDTWACISVSSNALLGMVKWYGPWRQYCLLPTLGTVFSAGCLRDIETFLKSLMKERKVELHGRIGTDPNSNS